MQKVVSSGTISFDTVSNTATNYLGNLTPVKSPLQSVTIYWKLTRLSGKIAGTVKVQGSLDGTNFATITGGATGSAQTTITADTLTRASATWVIPYNPFPYYRVTWTGSGVMAATQAAKLIAH